MQKINNINDLKAAILLLETRQAAEGAALKKQFQAAFDSVRPLSLVRSAIKEVSDSTELKNDLLVTTAGLTAGYLSKKLFVGVSHSIVKQLLGSALMLGVTKVVVGHPDIVRALGTGIMKMVSKKTPPETDNHTHSHSDPKEATF